MDGDILIRATALSKSYPRRTRPLAHMKRLLLKGTDDAGFAALGGVSLSLSRGEALGIVGRNGAGKSTLLQLLCGTQTPTSGTVERFGRVAAMLELGAGFNPEFTGRENVYLNAAIQGLSNADIAGRFAAIEAFADIGPFIDRPVKEYSSGMYARLAFAVCAHVDADVLVVDEILGVGDASFQAKCAAFIEKFLTHGAVVFVSHDELAVLAVCDRAIWLEYGVVMAEGVPESVLRQYRQAIDGSVSRPAHYAERAVAAQTRPHNAQVDGRAGKNPVQVSPFASQSPSHGHGGALIDDVYISDAEGRKLSRLQGGELITLNIRGRALDAVASPIVGFLLRDRVGQNLFGDNTYLEYRDRPRALAPGDRFHAMLEFRLPFLPVGTYAVAPSIIDGTQQTHVQLFWMEEALILTVHESPVRIGKIGVPMQIGVSLEHG